MPDDPGADAPDDDLYPDDGRPTSFSDLESISPIAELLGVDPSASDAMASQQEEQNRLVGEQTASCMREQGFEYTPNSNAGGVFFAFGDDGLEFFSAAWVDKYGLGISTMRFPQEMVGPDLVGIDFDLPGDQDDDPNQAYVNSLSDGEREAYYAALYGAEPDFNAEEMTEEELQAAFAEHEPTGCEAEARDAVLTQSSGIDAMGFYREFGDELQALEDRVEADPRMAEYRRRVDSCLSEAGWPVTSTYEDLAGYFEPRLEGLGSEPTDGSQPTDVQAVDPGDEGSEPEGSAFVMPSFGEMSEDDRATLAAVQAEEVELAKDLIKCDGGPLNEMWFAGSIRRDIEQQWIDANRDAIDELRSDG